MLISPDDASQGHCSQVGILLQTPPPPPPSARWNQNSPNLTATGDGLRGWWGEEGVVRNGRETHGVGLGWSEDVSAF